MYAPPPKKNIFRGFFAVVFYLMTPQLSQLFTIECYTVHFVQKVHKDNYRTHLHLSVLSVFF